MSNYEPIRRSLSVGELLSSGARYVVPMYQRNYAWEEGEITQLIADVLDYLDSGRNYYIGTLVVSVSTPVDFEVIDGQQRLTTLSLLAAFLKNRLDPSCSLLGKVSKPCLDFECRPASRRILEFIFSGRNVQRFSMPESSDSSADDVGASHAIEAGYRIIDRVLSQKLRERKVSEERFADYFMKCVHILRVDVPTDTDLNHYFEVMNNRGEQLEKHEVLKARLLQILQKHISNSSDLARSKRALHKVWEACANMEKYVQAGFSPRERGELFGKDWSCLHICSFDELARCLDKPRQDEAEGIGLIQLLKDPVSELKKNKPAIDDPERFHSVINFPNFLLQVLRVMTKLDVPLDDKKLLESFDRYLIGQAGSSRDRVNRIKEFVFTLFRCKYVFDHYIIKRELWGGGDAWSLKAYRKDKEGRGYYVNSFEDRGELKDVNRQLLMLISAFHVSTPTLAYKHWLNGALYWLFERKRMSGVDYLRYLESLAKAFVFDRYLSDAGLEYFEIIYKNRGSCVSGRDDAAASMEERLMYGSIENNFVFNYLDYLLWQDRRLKDKVVDGFHYTFRSSVEHYYPRHPKFGEPWSDERVLNCFGNLCLISHSKNSQLSNFLPHSKAEHYSKGALDSIKQYLMMRIHPWDIAAADMHNREMLGVLLDVFE